MTGRERNVFGPIAFLDFYYSCGCVDVSVACGKFRVRDGRSLDIAMNYLSRTDQAVNFRVVQTVAAKAIIAAWHGGVRHKIRLANCAIRAVETAEHTQAVPSAYPRVV
jgi:hypothetical protein